MSTLNIRKIDTKYAYLTIIGTSPLITHAWGEKARKMIRDKHAGKKTKDREPRDPEQEFKDAAYYTENGGYGIPAAAIRKALITAAHKDLGIEKTLVRKAIFIICEDPHHILPLKSDEPVFREDVVRVGMGTTDLRYRPEFRNWSIDLVIQFDADLINETDLVNLLQRAGFGVGLCEGRPEKNGENGRFDISPQVKTTSELIQEAA
jgi:hypothetical protein